MRKIIRAACVIAAVSVMSAPSFSQDTPAEKIMEGAYWKHKTSQFRTLPNPEGEICFLGDSITDGCEWRELTGIETVTNRGIGGDTSWGLLARIDEVTEGKPAKVFLMIGTNDLAWGGQTVPAVHKNIGRVLDAIKTQSPATKIYLQSILPVNYSREDEFRNKNIDAINPLLKQLAAEKDVTWIDLVPFFKDENGQLKEAYTEDGLHLTGEAYYQWLSVIRGELR